MASPDEGQTEDSDSEKADRLTATKRTFLQGTGVALGAGALPAGASATMNNSAGNSNSVAEAAGGMVSSVHEQATEAGVEILENGGNAVDAAAAVQFALNVVQPHSSGIGGGGFMLVYSAEEDEIIAIDNRERAPLGAQSDMFLDENGEEVPFLERHTNGKAVGVPGTLKAADVAVKRFGTRELGRLVQPAVELARSGGREVTVDEFLASAIEANVEDGGLGPTAKEVFAPGGDPLEEGDELAQPDLADTLRTIRDEGIGPFYKGEIAEDIAETVQGAARYRKKGGNMTVDDLGRYNVEITRPMYVTYEGDAHDITVRTMRSPTSGGYVIGQILSILEGFDLSQYDRRSFDVYHRMIEAFQLGFADRNEYLGDEEFVDIPWQGILDEDYIEERRKIIDPKKATDATREPGDPFAYQPGDQYYTSPRDVKAAQNVSNASGNKGNKSDSERPSGQTTHFTTADSDGNLVSWTSTIEQLFGSGIMVPDRGFMLNNELTDFDSEPGGPNEVQPEKRPLSSTSPTIVLRDGEPFLTVGSPGGWSIIHTVSQILLNVAEFGMNIDEAVAEPRVYSATGTWVQAEGGVPDDVVDELNAAGHDVSTVETIGNAQSIRVEEDGDYVGVADKRRNGSADYPR
ncbi:gamma-glutamyltranspeptidase / glutathione hydrolase [Halopelagius inordinatus]|uniref:Gamma-glutamyltranspeptidase / glutathione hydrolase n=1 Tax=Halopelagius inordinatus TaxID=553467 RepID=A0A1I2VP81_9EURY|nr:gamma-glutamyltransferase [Halopelagius inordinatus]SFG90883.1 gamma-glutamyltranspeptidase / glutathione hydrolase [Halopelagius inordinatus]